MINLESGLECVGIRSLCPEFEQELQEPPPDMEGVYFPQIWLKPRRDELLDHYRTEGGKDDRLRLVFAGFLWGIGGLAQLLVRLIREDDGSFKASQCLHRYVTYGQCTQLFLYVHSS
jgi:hypothetical protein